MNKIMEGPMIVDVCVLQARNQTCIGAYFSGNPVDFVSECYPTLGELKIALYCMAEEALREPPMITISTIVYALTNDAADKVLALDARLNQDAELDF